MRNKLEHILLSLLLGTSILLGLSFWLNIGFKFNLFYKEHWDELAKLQVTGTPINPWFYISIAIALFIFLSGLIIIYIPVIKSTQKQLFVETNTVAPAPVVNNKDIKEPETQIIEQPRIKETPTPVPAPSMPVSRPPRLNLPKNFEYVAKQHHEEQSIKQREIALDKPVSNTYNNELSNIFSENGYIVKPIPVISGFTPNLFAIGSDENVWIGGTDCKIEDLQNAISKLDSVFQETLEDITININGFLIDTLNQYSSDDSVLVFHSIEDLKTFISEHPNKPLSDDEKESFSAYSEYIDTIIQYIKNV
jgi:hypothetical protein